jgi:hypothetical protein
MKLSARTLAALGQLVTGEKGLTSYRSGPKLVQLFNDYGANDSYGQGFPSRSHYAESHLKRLNDTPRLAALIREILDPREFVETSLAQEAACDYLNAWIRHDGYEIVLENGIPKTRDIKGAAVEFTHPFEGSEKEGHVFIDQQLAKADEKIRDGDLDGAITNARSLIEAVLTELERELDASPKPYDGDLPRLYKRVQKLLNLDPARPDVEGPLKQVLAGLASIVSGLSGLSNKMGDRHVRTYRPDKRHAVLVVNAAKTLAAFLFETHRARKSGAG